VSITLVIWIVTISKGGEIMPEEDELEDSGEMRRFISDALKEFRVKSDPDDRLRSLWKIGQLVENTTDEELYELAAAAAVEEDHRLRGEICYTISRSHKPQLKPQLVQILRSMVQDRDPYVRRSAMTALGEMGGVREATLAAIDPILGDVDNLKTTVTNLEEKLISLYNSIEDFASLAAAGPPEHDFVMDDYARGWETYLRHERELLADHRGSYVAIYREEIVGIGEDQQELAEMIYEKYGSVEALICRIEEEDEPIRMPPPREIVE
jgi:hypothetical protein